MVKWKNCKWNTYAQNYIGQTSAVWCATQVPALSQMWKLALVSKIFSSRRKKETDSNKCVFHPTYVAASQGVILLCEKDVHSIAVKTANNHIQAVAEHLQIPLKLWKVQLPSCSSALWRDWLQWIITKAIKSHNYLAMSILGRQGIYCRKSNSISALEIERK